ncbi:MAG: acylphosphatase [Desulfobacterales bacterium]|jgi:acylphosphatase|nr:acylphosphatase [Desulfobacteraceae bacterium]MBT4364704.1 acylphosphatase [Desulfobacteraceae bacterium]MBT7086272.1 acylphosphatase [Desulfobacterales bacterium]MBT7697426.1 acylphosphatase [Desulfobacterales bacterium]
MKNKVRAHAVISGQVQGVFYRATTKETAENLGVRGWVKNKPDGNVEAVFEGEKKHVGLVLEWCSEGPLYAKVNRVDISWEEYSGEYCDFRISY